MLFVPCLRTVFIVTFLKPIFLPFSVWLHEIPHRNSSVYEATTMHGLVACGYDRIMWLDCIVGFVFYETLSYASRLSCSSRRSFRIAFVW